MWTFVDDPSEKQWRDVTGAIDHCVHASQRAEVLMIFCAVGTCIHIYFNSNFRAQPYDHP